MQHVNVKFITQNDIIFFAWNFISNEFVIFLLLQHVLLCFIYALFLIHICCVLGASCSNKITVHILFSFTGINCYDFITYINVGNFPV